MEVYNALFHFHIYEADSRKLSYNLLGTLRGSMIGKNSGSSASVASVRFVEVAQVAFLRTVMIGS